MLLITDWFQTTELPQTIIHEEIEGMSFATAHKANGVPTFNFRKSSTYSVCFFYT